MRRKDRQIHDVEQVRAILDKAQIIRLAMIDGEEPYIVAMNYARIGDSLYVHSAREGRKVSALEKNPVAAFQVEADVELVSGPQACDWSAKYKSVVGKAKVSFVSDTAEQVKALEAIMIKHAGPGDWGFPEPMLKRTLVLRIDILEMTGKQNGYSTAE